MSNDEFNRLAYPIALVMAAFGAFLFPLLRGWRATGKWPVANWKSTQFCERIIGISLFGCGLLFAVWSVLYALLGPHLLGVWSVPTWLVLVGWFVAAIGLGIVLVAQHQMRESWRIGVDAEVAPLVTHGLFRVCRNPIYSGVMLAFIALVLVSPSPYIISLVLITMCLVAIQARIEERHLARAHGVAFHNWAEQVGRFVPLLGRLRS